MKNILHVDATFKLERSWEITHPDTYDVHLKEPLQKCEGTYLGLLSAEQISIIVILQQSGLVDWVIGKGYDQLWQYLRAMSRALPNSPTGRRCTIEIKDSNEVVRAKINFNHFDVEQLEYAEIEAKTEIQKLASGDYIETSYIKLKIGK